LTASGDTRQPDTLSDKTRRTFLEKGADAFFIVLRPLERAANLVVERDRVLEFEVGSEIEHLLDPGEAERRARFHPVRELEGFGQQVGARHNPLHDAK
jgi:hypothetical protein